MLLLRWADYVSLQSMHLIGMIGTIEVIFKFGGKYYLFQRLQFLQYSF